MPRLLAALFALTLAAPALAQGLQKVAIQTDSPRQQSLPTTTLRTGTQLVIVDVVVMDKNKQPVHGLKAKDFTLLEGGAAQRFKGFEEHTAPTAEEIARMPLLPKLAEGTFSNFAAAATPRADGPLNILLLDRLNTAVADQKQMQKQINDYLLHAPAGQRMAIFGLTDHLMMLQGFTTDAGAIHKGVNSAEGLQSTGLLSPPVEMLFGSTGDDADNARGPTAAMTSDTDPHPETHRREVLAADQVELRVTMTLHAMDELARYLAILPGRKNLIWFSGSFPVDIMPTMGRQGEEFTTGSAGSVAGRSPGAGSGFIPVDNPFVTVRSQQKGFEQTSALLSRSQVAVYPIDVKGLRIASIFNADDNGCGGCRAANPRELSRNVDQGLTGFDEHNYGENSTMNELAEGTGGKAFLNTNDFSEAVRRALDDGANYYTIAYDPSDSHWNGSFRRIQVKLKEQGYNLSYRRGYFADDPDALGNAKGNVASTAAPASPAMMLALTHGGPQPTQLMFTARVLPVSASTEESLAPGNKTGKGGKAPYRRYRVDFAIDPRAIHFSQTPDGNRHETLEFVTHVYDADGNLVDSVGTSIKTTVTPAEYEQFRRTGLPFHHEVSVPAKGDYYLRIAMHDVEVDQVGAIELPVASVQNLPPLAAAASSPAK